MKNTDYRRSKAELWIEAIRITCDMGIENCRVISRAYDASALYPGEEICIDEDFCGAVKVVSVSESEIILHWSDIDINVRFDGVTRTKECLVGNHDIRGKLSLRISYHTVPSHKALINRIIDIGTAGGESLEIWWEKHLTKHFIDIDITHGRPGMRVAKALLDSCDDWSALEITDINNFRVELLNGIEEGALSPTDYEGWEWLETAAKNNDPQQFMEDIERFYDILCEATENGVTEARDIMDTIWEPENCQEED